MYTFLGGFFRTRDKKTKSIANTSAIITRKLFKISKSDLFVITDRITLFYFQIFGSTVFENRWGTRHTFFQIFLNCERIFQTLNSKKMFSDSTQRILSKILVYPMQCIIFSSENLFCCSFTCILY